MKRLINAQLGGELIWQCRIEDRRNTRFTLQLRSIQRKVILRNITVHAVYTEVCVYLTCADWSNRVI